MSAEPATRSLLPGHGFVHQPREQPSKPRVYVFVDEHNRQKRLKVMRACDSCRRKKIKCDAATTNTWPCGACSRGNHPCVPPTVSYEGDDDGESPTFKVPTPQQYRTVDHVQIYQPSMSQANVVAPPVLPQAQTLPRAQAGIASADTFGDLVDPFMTQSPLSYHHVPTSSSSNRDFSCLPQLSFDSTYHPLAGDLACRRDVSPDTLVDALGELSIDHTGVAPYIKAQGKNLAATRAVEEKEAELPLQQNQTTGSTIRIPPEMFPSDQHALRYFQYFFDNIHPYLPVISRTHFFRQWKTDKHSISPLLLEAIFACAATHVDGQQEGAKWLALASKHEDSFKDAARLSTIQAILILLKAREAAPKRGYYYRSWMTLVMAVSMSIELELHDHLDVHRNGTPCGSLPHECAVKTRIWQMLFALEIMIGGPQGRSDFRVAADTVDFSVPVGVDGAELEVSRRFVYMVRVAKNVKGTNLKWQALKRRKKDWGLDPGFVAHNHTYEQWMHDLPQDLEIPMPADGRLPWIPSHFVAQMHIYHHLSIIMQHRPQLHFLSDMGDPGWRAHMLLCHASAKTMCRLQEAIVSQHGISSLSCMLRGLSFTIYSVLTCTMLHLAAITAPEPDLNDEAPDYFCRHMRLLEQCVPLWDMPEMHHRINSIREAFSEDTTKPFELKRTFPHGSPPQHQLSQSPSFAATGAYGPVGIPTAAPAHDGTVAIDAVPGQLSNAVLHGHHVAFALAQQHPITPPFGTPDSEPGADSPLGHSLVKMSSAPAQMASMAPTSHMSAGAVAGASSEPGFQPWNPTRFFDQWTATFSPAPSSTQSPTSHNAVPFDLNSVPVDTWASANAVYSQQTQPGSYSSHLNGIGPSVPHNPYQQMRPPTSQVSGYVSPGQWQDLVASSFGDGGLKRRWDGGYGGGIGMDETMTKRSR